MMRKGVDTFQRTTYNGHMRDRNRLKEFPVENPLDALKDAEAVRVDRKRGTVLVWSGGVYVHVFEVVSDFVVRQWREVEVFASDLWGGGGLGETDADRQKRVDRERPLVILSMKNRIDDPTEYGA